ncbi:MAG: cation transporter [Candidatus Yonathbacteria bacterium]|nr:cation transporter [Candidatus Yonathbacteria bacterium]
MTNGHFKGCATPTDCWCEVKRYGILFGIAGMILIAEVVGGIVSQSLALLADAGHVLTDTGAILVAIIVSYRVKCGANEVQARKLGGYINALLLGGVAVWVFVEAIERFQEPREVVSWVMISIAVVGTIGNYVQHRMMESANEDHVTHESMHLHILSDLLQSIGVVLGGSLIWVTGWVLIDPIISIVIALLMAWWTWKLLKKLRSGEYDGNGGHCCHGHGHDHHH